MISQNQTQSSEPKQNRNHSTKRSFIPHCTDIIEIKRSSTWNRGNATCIYNQRHNTIIVCPTDGTIQFYNAQTLLPHKSKEVLWICEAITKIDYCNETDVFLMGSLEGVIYSYNASDHTFKRLRNEINQMVLSIAFLNSQYYAFSLSESKRLSIGSLQQEDFLSWNSKNSDSECLSLLAKGNTLLSGHMNGSVIVYGINQLPKLPILCTYTPEQGERKSVMKIDSVRISNKECIITIGSNGKIRVWNLVKGRMRLLRIINIGRIIHNGIYLENYKMLAVTCPGSIKFVSLLTGKVKSTFHLGMEVEKFFLMNDKNTLGVVDQQNDRIKMVKLNSGTL